MQRESRATGKLTPQSPTKNSLLIYEQTIVQAMQQFQKETVNITSSERKLLASLVVIGILLIVKICTEILV